MKEFTFNNENRVFFAILDIQEGKLRNGFTSTFAGDFVKEVASKIVEVSNAGGEDTYNFISGEPSLQQAKEVFKIHGFALVTVPSYIHVLLKNDEVEVGVVNTSPEYFFDGSLIGVKTVDLNAVTNPEEAAIRLNSNGFTPSAFWKKMDAVKEHFKNVFILESFDDFLDDMDNTDWDYYDQEEDYWMKSLYALSVTDIVAKLTNYGSDFEEDAYKQGFLPENEGLDVRNWSNILVNYL